MPKTDAIPTFDPAAVFSQFKLASVDAVIAAQRRNLEAVSAANKATADGFKALTTRQFEFARGAVDAYVAAVREVMTAKDLKASAARQVEYAKAAFETTAANSRELAEIAVRANAEAFDALNKRVVESLDEVRDLTRDEDGAREPAKRDRTKPDQTGKDTSKKA